MQAAANAMARTGVVEGKIVLVSSLLGFMGLVGYAQYAPMKHAIRGKPPLYPLTDNFAVADRTTIQQA